MRIQEFRRGAKAGMQDTFNIVNDKIQDKEGFRPDQRLPSLVSGFQSIDNHWAKCNAEHCLSGTSCQAASCQINLGQLLCGPQWVDVAYTKNGTCIPDTLYPVAALVDKMNGQELLTGTCIQI
jgi:hypothetical protein